MADNLRFNSKTHTNSIEGGTIISPITPILFCTNKGLHIRSATATQDSVETIYNYQIKFCDLEQWTSKRSGSVTLMDAHIENSQTEASKLVDKKILESDFINKSRLLDHPQPTGVFTKAYARFDVK